MIEIDLIDIANWSGVYSSKLTILGSQDFITKNSTISKLFSWIAQCIAALPHSPS